MSDDTPDVTAGDETEREELRAIAAESALDARNYITTVTEVASGQAADTAIPLLLLATSRVEGTVVGLGRRSRRRIPGC